MDEGIRDARALRTDRRRADILAAARQAAEADGWPAVTVRRLADAIGFTQPVIYSHFPAGKAEIIREVALGGFSELTAAVREAAAVPASRRPEAVARAYLDFAVRHPALYEAMFQLPIGARFAEEDGESELREGFAAIAAAIGDEARGVVTETFWSALHGMSVLERFGRMRPADREARIAELARRFAD